MFFHGPSRHPWETRFPWSVSRHCWGRPSLRRGGASDGVGRGRGTRTSLPFSEGFISAGRRLSERHITRAFLWLRAAKGMVCQTFFPLKRKRGSWWSFHMMRTWKQAWAEQTELQSHAITREKRENKKWLKTCEWLLYTFSLPSLVCLSLIELNKHSFAHQYAFLLIYNRTVIQTVVSNSLQRSVPAIST